MEEYVRVLTLINSMVDRIVKRANLRNGFVKLRGGRIYRLRCYWVTLCNMSNMEAYKDTTEYDECLNRLILRRLPISEGEYEKFYIFFTCLV